MDEMGERVVVEVVVDEWSGCGLKKGSVWRRGKKVNGQGGREGRGGRVSRLRWKVECEEEDVG